MTIHVFDRIAWQMDGWNGRLDHHMVEDYAARKGMSIETVERWLASQLGY